MINQNMTLKAVFFGSIGSFSESSKLQLDSFNQSMRINKIDEIWNEEEYMEYLKISGGINRLKSILPENVDESIIKKIHLNKTKIFQQKILESGPLIRPGFEGLCEELLESNIMLGIASTTSKKTIENIMQRFFSEPRFIGEKFSSKAIEYDILIKNYYHICIIIYLCQLFMNVYKINFFYNILK